MKRAIFFSGLLLSQVPTLAAHPCAEIVGRLGSGARAFESPRAEFKRAVPLVRLLAVPEVYAGQTVLTFGHLASDGDGFALFMDADSVRFNVQVNAVGLSLSERQVPVACAILGSIVLVQGTFRATRSTATVQTGWIEEVTRIRPRPMRSSPK
jgi:hypothetical protein